MTNAGSEVRQFRSPRQTTTNGFSRQISSASSPVSCYVISTACAHPREILPRTESYAPGRGARRRPPAPHAEAGASRRHARDTSRSALEAEGSRLRPLGRGEKEKDMRTAITGEGAQAADDAEGDIDLYRGKAAGG